MSEAARKTLVAELYDRLRARDMHPGVPLVAALSQDPDLLAALELGLAWQAAEAALPDMPAYVTPRTKWALELEQDMARHWLASAIQDVDDDWQAVETTGSTPAEALRNLAAALKP